MILRVYGQATATHPRDADWEEKVADFPILAGSRQIFDLRLDLVQTLMGGAHPNPFVESVARATSYREAGADCLYVPGIADAETIGRFVKEVGAPVNVVMGLAGTSMSVNQLEDLGVKRVSVGGSLARAIFGLIRRASAEARDRGTFGYAEEQVPDAELCQFFAARQDPTAPQPSLRAMCGKARGGCPRQVPQFWTVVRTDDHDCPPSLPICS